MAGKSVIEAEVGDFVELEDLPRGMRESKYDGILDSLVEGRWREIVVTEGNVEGLRTALRNRAAQRGLDIKTTVRNGNAYGMLKVAPATENGAEDEASENEASEGTGKTRIPRSRTRS